jgi:Spy/CpxP family protein refolding chaperone
MRHSKLTRNMLPAAAVAAMIALLSLLSAPLPAQSDPPGATAAAVGGLHHGMMMHHFAAMKALNLTDEQKASAKQLMQEMKAKSAPLWQAQRALAQQYRAALAAESPDAAAVGKIAIQMHENRQQMKPVMQEFHQKFQALLTPEQQTKFQALQQSHHFQHDSLPRPDSR